MTEDAMDIGRCPKCGGELEIPERMTEFCCLYCGEKLTHDMLIDDALPASPEQSGMDYVLGEIGLCLVGRNALLDKFRRSHYEPAFREYLSECRPVFAALSAEVNAVNAAEGDSDALIDAAASALLEAVSAELEGNKRWKRAGGRRELLDSVRMLLVTYFAPMVRYLSLPVSADFGEAFRDIWKQRYPEYPYEIGSFDEINSGFRSFKDIFRLSRR